jgi:thymidylate synthase ThyX
MISATVIEDSLTPDGEHRLTTMVVELPRIVLSQFNTYRVFSRNASSSRAIPFALTVARVEDEPFIPKYWGKNQPGMQAKEEVDPVTKSACAKEWLEARDDAVRHAKKLAEMGLAKELVNRLLEPWSYVTVLVSSTEWDNFYHQRTDEHAQHEIREVAEAMLAAQNASTPRRLEYGEWHLPFVTPEEREKYPVEIQIKLSVARCRRVSYRNHDKTDPVLERDIDRHDECVRLGHFSPTEHQAKVIRGRYWIPEWDGNLRGFTQYRKTILDEEGVRFERLLRPWEESK